MLRVWAAMINVGKWGLPKKEGTVEIVPKYEEAERPALTNFILRAARYHIKARNGGAFISPPQNQMIIRDQSWVRSFEWQLCDHQGDILDSHKGIMYPQVCNPRTATYTYGDVIKMTTEPAITAPPAERQEQWNITPAKGGKSKSYTAVAKTKSQPQTLGTWTQIRTRHMLDTLGVQTTSDSNVPSGQKLGLLEMYP